MEKKICEKIQTKINTLSEKSRKAGIEKDIPRVAWLKEDLKLMKKTCKEVNCPQVYVKWLERDI